MRLFAILTALLAACATTETKKEDVVVPALINCQDHSAARAASEKAAGHQLFDSDAGVSRNGVFMYGAFWNKSTNMAVIEMQVDNRKLAEQMAQTGFKETGKCVRGDHTWTIMEATVPYTGKELIPKDDFDEPKAI